MPRHHTMSPSLLFAAAALFEPPTPLPPVDPVTRYARRNGLPHELAEVLVHFDAQPFGGWVQGSRFEKFVGLGYWPYLAEPVDEAAAAAYFAQRPGWTKPGNIWHGPAATARIAGGELIVMFDLRFQKEPAI
jgi:hypothetical protein